MENLSKYLILKVPRFGMDYLSRENIDRGSPSLISIINVFSIDFPSSLVVFGVSFLIIFCIYLFGIIDL